MTNKSLAKQELLEILVHKFPNCRNLIEIELQDFFASKSKITVKDLDELEQNIKKLSGWKRPNRLLSSSLDKSIEINPSPIPMQTPKPELSPSPYKLSLVKNIGKKIVERTKDHILFPKDTLSLENLSFSNDRKIKENDDWGKIIHADHLRFLSVTFK